MLHPLGRTADDVLEALEPGMWTQRIAALVSNQHRTLHILHVRAHLGCSALLNFGAKRTALPCALRCIPCHALHSLCRAASCRASCCCPCLGLSGSALRMPCAALLGVHSGAPGGVTTAAW